MLAEYDLYCTADPHYYDLPENSPSSRKESFTVLQNSPDPEGWIRSDNGEWVSFIPDDGKIPLQGWKVHVSSRTENADKVVSRVWDYCMREKIAFKITASPEKFWNKNTKYAERTASGKLVTIYPSGEAQLHKVLVELGEELRGEEGPYILSDVRWEDGPLYTRYGAFAKRLSDDGSGNGRISIENPSGDLEPDPRNVVFTVPEWVTVPSFLQPHIDRHRKPVLDEFPYTVEEAVHFSNGGGVYRAVDRRTGLTVILKEGRPHAGLDSDGNDAVARLRWERDVLRHLSALPQVPAVVDYHTIGEHEFLVQEYIDGTPLHSEGAKRNPLTRRLFPDRRELRKYSQWALRTWEQVAQAVRRVHEHGVVFGDLHPNNVLVTDSGEVALIDWEAASFERDDRLPPMGNPGFMAPSDRRGFEIDEYALALLKLALFAPITSLTRLSPAKMRHVAELICATYMLDTRTFADALDIVCPEGEALSVREGPYTVDEMGAQHGSWTSLRCELAEGILDSATPERDDRLFPGDIEQFKSPYGGLGFAYGAAGVLWTLHRTLGIRFPEGERWLRDRAMADRDGAPRGFCDGDHGIAHSLWELGYGDEAVELLERAHRKGEDKISIGVEKGLSGIGLNWLHFFTECGTDTYLQRAIRTADALRKRLADADHVAWSSSDSPGGVLRGHSGAALFFTRMYEVTGERSYLETAAEALHRDLDKCTTDEHGALLLKDGFRTLPYLASGSAGIGLALRRYLTHVDDSDLRTRCEAIADAVSTAFCLFPGLFDGRSGLIVAAAGLYDPDDPASQTRIRAQVHGLNWHVLLKDGRRVFPGNQLLKLSCDLATGSSGVLLALHAADQLANASEAIESFPFFSSGHTGRSRKPSGENTPINSTPEKGRR